MVYIVTYDLIEPGQRYQELIDMIKKKGPWAKLGESAYLIKSDLTPVQLRDVFKSALDGNDKLYVGQVNAPAAWAGLSDVVSKWVLEELK